MKHRLLLIDNEKYEIEGLVLFLEANGFTVDFAESGEHGIALYRQRPGKYSLVIVDFFMPGMDGCAVIRELRRLDPFVLAMGLSGDSSVETHNMSLAAGAESFFVKGNDIKKLGAIVQRFCDRFEEANKVFTIPTSLDEKIKIISSSGIVGCSNHLLETTTLIKKYAITNETVLIRGENGTGKELIAKAIHQQSDRARKPFLSLNINSLSETLFESELFGSEKGAFTGAYQNRKGKFQQANGGTLFLDEIGDLKMEMQVKLLRALQEREITPVGAEKSIKVDIRIVAATNVDLEEAVKSGKFREDLYYRFKVLPINLLPLRERKEDIGPLVNHFVSEYNFEMGTEKAFMDKTVELLSNYDWPGNIRELEHEVKRLLAVTDNKDVEPTELDDRFKILKGEKLIEEFSELEQDTWERERAFFVRMLSLASSIREGSRIMKISKTTLLRKMKELKIEFNKESTI